MDSHILSRENLLSAATKTTRKRMGRARGGQEEGGEAEGDRVKSDQCYIAVSANRRISELYGLQAKGKGLLLEKIP